MQSHILLASAISEGGTIGSVQRVGSLLYVRAESTTEAVRSDPIPLFVLMHIQGVVVVTYVQQLMEGEIWRGADREGRVP